MKAEDILLGHHAPETSYKVEDYPYGYTTRTTKYYWVETRPGKGDRLCYCTLNPKNGKPNKVKSSVYRVFEFMYLDEIGHVKTSGFEIYDIKAFENTHFPFLRDTYGLSNLLPEQCENIRRRYHASLIIALTYDLKEKTEQQQEAFKQWMKERAMHVKTCPFAELIFFRPFDDSKG